MIVGLLIAGSLCLLIGGAFFWLNTNTPVQTRIPALALPLGAALVLFGLGMIAA